MAKIRSQLVSWRGWDPRTGARALPDPTAAFERSAPPFPNPESRYQLLAVAARGFHPPQALSTNVATKDGHADHEADEFPGLRCVWSVLYRQIAETAPATERPYAIYLLGVNAPEEVSEKDRATFNDFYTNVHLVEVAERRHALRAVRYELIEEVKSPYLGAPQYLAAYEVDESSASHRRHVGPPYSAGPDVWQRHTTPWRLWYRRLGA
ncbi:MAG TPA: hypothetical protein VG246_08635 [Acidimicrobiales bacterium]|nr:hypothetical protein [Acidimicrobiales bacterium]